MVALMVHVVTPTFAHPHLARLDDAFLFRAAINHILNGLKLQPLL